MKAYNHQANRPTVHTIKANKLERPKRHKIEKALKRRKWYQDEEALLDEKSSRNEGDRANVIVQVGGAQKDGRPSVRAGDTVSALPHEMEPSESIYYLPISEVGLVDLVRVQDRDKYDFRIRPSSPVIVAECPSQGHFVLGSGLKSSETQTRCIGDIDHESVVLRGTGPLALRYTVSKHGHTTPEEYVLRDIGQTRITGSTEETSGVMSAGQAPNSNVERVLRRLTEGNEFGAAQNHVVDIPLRHNQPGFYTVEISSLYDGLGNFHYPTSQETKRSYQVQTLPVAKFNLRRSGSTGDQVFIKENSTAILHLDIDKDSSADDATIQIRYDPEPSCADSISSIETVRTKLHRYNYAVSKPGTYTIQEVLAGKCKGSSAGSMVTVIEVPPPESRIEIVPEHDWCVGLFDDHDNLGIVTKNAILQQCRRDWFPGKHRVYQGHPTLCFPIPFLSKGPLSESIGQRCDLCNSRDHRHQTAATWHLHLRQ